MHTCEIYRAGKNYKFCICYDCLQIIENNSKAGTTDSDGKRRINRKK
jgi:hypothetical protein